MGEKCDNHNPKAKLDLRRYFLKKFHADGQPIRVFDCCQGSGLLWGELRKEFEVASYWGVDVKPKAGRLKIDNARVLAQGLAENVIDIDSYGNCWPSFFAMIPKVSQPVTVFLTRGSHSFETLCKEEKQAIGLTIKVPEAFFPKLHMIDTATRYCVSSIRGVRIIEAVEAVSDGNARYIGLRLEPMKTNGPQLVPASRSEHIQSLKEIEHV